MRLIYLIAALILVSCQKSKTENPEKEGSKTDTLQQKNGNSISFHTWPQKLILLKRDQSVYSENYSKRLYKIAEYYLDTTTQQLINYQKTNPKGSLGFSVEENDWEEVNYTQIGIFSKVGNNVSTLQWLFYNPKTQELFEFDLRQKKLVLFPMK